MPGHQVCAFMGEHLTQLPVGLNRPWMSGDVIGLTI